jgi:hypothetical protein
MLKWLLINPSILLQFHLWVSFTFLLWFANLNFKSLVHSKDLSSFKLSYVKQREKVVKGDASAVNWLSWKNQPDHQFVWLSPSTTSYTSILVIFDIFYISIRASDKWRKQASNQRQNNNLCFIQHNKTLFEVQMSFPVSLVDASTSTNE